MNTRRLTRTLACALISIGLCAATAALADNELATIKVEASVISKKVIETSASGIPTEEVSVTRWVGYEDLDLKTHAGATELKRRVEESARLACKQLDELYPLEQSEAPTCERDATAAAQEQVDKALAAAESGAKEE